MTYRPNLRGTRVNSYRPRQQRVVRLPGGVVAAADAARAVWDAALCAEEDPELFFPDRGDELATAVARSVCERCPVRSLCLATFGPLADFGVVGGLTAEERRELRTTERPAAA